MLILVARNLWWIGDRLMSTPVENLCVRCKSPTTKIWSREDGMVCLSCTNNKTLIIQTSPLHTASTVLVNGLYGMFPETSNMNVTYYEDCADELYSDEETLEDFLRLKTPYPFGDVLIIKSHHTRLDYYLGKYGDSYDIYFVSSERKEKESPEYMMPQKYRDYSNLILFDYEEINETSSYSVENIVDGMVHKLSQTIPYLNFNTQGAVERIKNMNARYEEIKDMPFDYKDDLYAIHGSHRNRNHHTPSNPYWT